MASAPVMPLRPPTASEAVPSAASSGAASHDVLQTIGATGKQRWKSALRWAIALLVIGGLITALVLWRAQSQVVELGWQTQAAERGDIRVTVDATGTLEPETEVIVGAEVSGRIAEVLVDENDPVAVGQVLARFDLESFETELAEAKASLAGAKAEARRARANLAKLRHERERTERLADQGIASQEERETRESAVALAEAELDAAQAQRQLAQARIDQIETKIEKAVVGSPIDGVVLRRQIEPGSTVAASFQSPELFTIAADLHVMQLDLAIDEADVGQIVAGQRATFVVDAWPEREFEATVTKVALAPTITGNVVSYVAELSVDNEEGLLRPGMTATATILTGTRREVLRVPTRALRFNPPQEQGSSGFRFGPPQTTRQHASGSAVWVLQQGQPVRVAIKTGASDGDWTEVIEGELEAGSEVIVGVEQEGAQP